MWRHVYRYSETQLLEYVEQPKSENHSVLAEAYSPRAQALAVNRAMEPFGPADAPRNEIQVEPLAEGLVTGLQARQDKWL